MSKGLHEPKNGVLIDRYGRPVIGVRISVNASFQCNYSCIFCHNEGITGKPEEMMKPEEIERIVKVLKSFGVNYVKLTGGEPLLRPDILEIVKRLGAYHLRELSMTTNGTRLYELAEPLKKAGLHRVNISLHSLKEGKYNFITGSTRLQTTLDAIRAAVDAGLTPVKLNVVILKGINDDEVDDLIRFAETLGGGENIIVQLIELVMEGASNSHFYKRFHTDLLPIEEALKKRAVKEVIRALHFRHRYLQPNGVWVEVVRPMHNSVFCMGDNRIRITHDGKFKPCLLRDDNHVDFLTPMRNGASDKDLANLFRLAVHLREPYFKPSLIQNLWTDKRIYMD